MAVQLEFLNLIVPIRTIRNRYPKGFEGCLHDHAKSIGRTAWYDEHLLRTGAMDPEVMDKLVENWVGHGFTATELNGGKTVWADFCVVDAFGRSLHGCEWIMVDGVKRIAWLRGAEVGIVVGRGNP